MRVLTAAYISRGSIGARLREQLSSNELGADLGQPPSANLYFVYKSSWNLHQTSRAPR